MRVSILGPNPMISDSIHEILLAAETDEEQAVLDRLRERYVLSGSGNQYVTIQLKERSCPPSTT